MGAKDFDAPGIKIKDGRLERLDLTLNGTVRLGPLSVTANQLRAEYSRNSGKLYITGTVKFELVKGKFVEFGFPEPERSTGVASKGLEIDTNTGEVKLNSLEVAVGGIQIKFVTIEDLRLRWISNGPNDFSIAGSMTLTVGIPKDGKPVPTVKWKGDIKFEFQNNNLSAIEFKVTNSGTGMGKLQTSSFDGRISGLDNEEQFKLTANVRAEIPVAGGIGGAKLLDISGGLEVTRDTIRVKGRASVYSDQLFTGSVDLSVDLATSRLKLDVSGSGLGKILQGSLTLDLEMNTGYFNAGARLGIYTPPAIPLVGGKRVGEIGVNVVYGPREQTGYEVILPYGMEIPYGENYLEPGILATTSTDERFWARRYSADGRVILELQDNGKLLLKRGDTGAIIWQTPLALGRIGTNAGFLDKVLKYSLEIQQDGNLVVYQTVGFQGHEAARYVVWSANTKDKTSNPRLSIQSDGNLVLWDASNKQKLEKVWETNTKTITVQSAAIAIAIAMHHGASPVGLANAFAADLEQLPRNRAPMAERLKGLAANIQVRKTVFKNDFLSVDGYVKLEVAGLKASFWPHYEANLDTNGYRVWLDYDPPIFAKDTYYIASRGSLVIPGIRIVNSFSSQRSAATSRMAAAPAAVAAEPVFYDLDQTLLPHTKVPTITIKKVTVDRSHNNATVSFESSADIPASVSLYIDTDGSGRNGFQIDDGLLSNNRLQTFRLSDIADRLPANVEKGEKLYIYAVIDDGVHKPVFSRYSAAIVAPDFDPTITVPSAQKLMVDERLTFSSSNGNAITIKDPVLAIEKFDRNDNDSNELVVVLSTKGYGALHLKKIPATVTVTGNHTGNITLQGTASNITAALQDMVYDPILGANSDQIAIGVRRANSDFVATYVAESIDINVDTFQVHGIHNVNIDPDDGLTEIFSNVDIDSVYSDTIGGIFVQIDNYEKGQDLLSLNTEGIEDILEDGISVRFDEELGRLFFAGGGMTEETCEQLLENVEFMTTDSDAAKSVTVRMKNSVDEVDKFSQLLL